LNLRHIDAIDILVPFMEPVVLPEGVVRLSENQPSEDKELLASKAMLATSSNLPPDTQRLLLTVAEEVEQPLLWCDTAGEFPSNVGLYTAVSSIAQIYYLEDQRALERFLPFQIASPLERFYLLIFPILLLLYPLLRSSPGLYRGVLNRRINRWYSVVREVKLNVSGNTLVENDAQQRKLQALNRELPSNFNVPTAYMERYYNLRFHIGLALDELRVQRQGLLAEGA
jgi:hypothetical protein